MICGEQEITMLAERTYDRNKAWTIHWRLTKTNDIDAEVVKDSDGEHIVLATVSHVGQLETVRRVVAEESAR